MRRGLSFVRAEVLKTLFKELYLFRKLVEVMACGRDDIFDLEVPFVRTK